MKDNYTAMRKNCLGIRKDLNGGQGRNRTADASLFRAALYQLSYLAILTRWTGVMRSEEQSLLLEAVCVPDLLIITNRPHFTQICRNKYAKKTYPDFEAKTLRLRSFSIWRSSRRRPASS